MNHLRAATIVLLFVFSIDAEPSDYQALRSKPSGDIILEIWVNKAHGTNYSISVPIRYNFLTITNRNCPIDLPNEGYFCSAQMFDSAGNSVQLSVKHSAFGKRFYDLKYPSADQPWSNALRDVLSMKPARITGPSGPSLGLGAQMESDFVIAEQNAGEQRLLPSFDDLFVVRRPGVYKVRLQIQVYARIYKGGTSFAYKLERFEPMEFAVTNDKENVNSTRQP